MNQRQIARLQLVHVPQHLGLGMVLIENRMRQERCGPIESLVVTRVGVDREIVGSEVRVLAAVKGSKDVVDVVVVDSLIEGDADGPVFHEAHVDATTLRLIDDLLRVALADRYANRVEKIVVNNGEAETTKTLAQGSCVAVYSTCDTRQPL